MARTRPRPFPPAARQARPHPAQDPFASVVLAIATALNETDLPLAKRRDIAASVVRHLLSASAMSGEEAFVRLYAETAAWRATASTGGGDPACRD